MPLLDTFLSVIAPHDCLRCGREGSLLCHGCQSDWLQALPSRCYSCHRLTLSSKVCPGCFHKTALRAVYVSGQYDEAAKSLVHKLKFGRARAAAEIMAAIMSTSLPQDFEGMVLAVPTASSRRRQRGYDQAVLLARSLARKRALPMSAVLKRRGQSRQVGQKRQQRLKQLQEAFYVTKASEVVGRRVLLVDDVLTTGATLEAAASTLKAAGARRVEAIVFAQA